MRERDGILKHVDGITIILWFVLSIAGIFAIFSASAGGEQVALMDLGGKHSKQAIFWVLSLITGFVILTADYRLIKAGTFPFYIFCLFLLLLTLVIGVEINGAKAWIRYGSFQIQPAEFAKLATCLMLALYISDTEKVFKSFRKTLFAGLIIVLPLAFIILQPDVGSCILYAGLIFVLYREGLTPAPIYLGLIAIGLALSTLAFGFWKVAAALILLAIVLVAFTRKNKRKALLKPLAYFGGIGLAFSLFVSVMFTKVLADYQQDRVMLILGKIQDKRGAGYNLWQSKMAVGSGGFSGKGFMQGTQTQGDFVPEITTDYIFSSIGEEWGFLGSLFVVGLLAALIFRLLFLAERQRSAFSRIFIYSTASFLFMHTFINIAMVVGLFPTIGIPLPFFSYGGSSLLAFSLMIAIALRLDAQRLYLFK